MDSADWLRDATEVVAYEPHYMRHESAGVDFDASGQWHLYFGDPDDERYVGGSMKVPGLIDDLPETLTQALADAGLEVAEPGWLNDCPGVWSARVRAS